ncbi:hypothetical protein AVEN_119931-1 [Araneus ventricosus]|uniref:Reverse transcriptase domain-containing protein n=1 Tax=Araneus ventricosus TaxID=182803 RepID=A0A4Y2I0Y9_ARAVE|nr:hypothetical protein AVEN_119931-1 [Araneus ventricosus]
MTFGKTRRTAEILVNPNKSHGITIQEKINLLFNYFFPPSSNVNESIYTPNIERVEELTEKELDLVMHNLKKGKVPGLDILDFKVWAHIYDFNEDFLIVTFNLCFKYNYLPKTLRNAKIFFLQKQGKDPEQCPSYRPVCLLPAIGKILERKFQFRFSKHLADKNVIHENQFGFREGKSCEWAIINIISKIRENEETKHCALISLDIKSTVDSMDW